MLYFHVALMRSGVRPFLRGLTWWKAVKTAPLRLWGTPHPLQPPPTAISQLQPSLLHPTRKPEPPVTSSCHGMWSDLVLYSLLHVSEQSNNVFLNVSKQTTESVSMHRPPVTSRLWTREVMTLPIVFRCLLILKFLNNPHSNFFVIILIIIILHFGSIYLISWMLKV